MDNGSSKGAISSGISWNTLWIRGCGMVAESNCVSSRIDCSLEISSACESPPSGIVRSACMHSPFIGCVAQLWARTIKESAL